MSTFLNWLIVSSTSPEGEERLALTIKGFAVWFPAIVTLSAYLGHPVGLSDLNAILNSLLAVVLALLSLGGALASAYGLIRKIYRTVNF